MDCAVHGVAELDTTGRLSVQKTKIMASSPITSCQTDGKTKETVTAFVFLGSKSNVDGDWSHEIKTLAPWKKSYDKPRQHIKKQRHHFAEKDLYIQNCGFPKIMYGYESWTPKKA